MTLRGHGRSSGRALTRGQTTLDFAVAMSLFIVVLATAIAMVPSLFAPFGASSASDRMVADRVSDRLSNGFLSSTAGETARIDANCTREFFDADGDVSARCPYEADADSLPAALGTAAHRNLNVTIEDEGGVQTLSGVRLAAGETPPASRSTTITRRLVLLNDRTLRLKVRVW